ncbi:MAG: 50S ribosomal protein L9 [Gammaproteobacteria bacterium]|nr:50S ribosomal protein L9 [Gammaproteobacteria bacterium]MCY4340884.1 50S ribosomal protein L9 [Gammaproteobacteria bacterium]
MRIILLESVESLGGIGDIVDVRGGYGRNFLLPQGKAAPATDAQIAAFEARRSELLALEKERMAATAARAQQVRSVAPLTIVANAGPAGKLFGSVGAAEISAGFAEAGVEVARAEIQMPEGPIKELGEHQVALKLHADVREEVVVRVVGQAGETEVLPGADPLPADEDEGEVEVEVEGEGEVEVEVEVEETQEEAANTAAND